MFNQNHKIQCNVNIMHIKPLVNLYCHVIIIRGALYIDRAPPGEGIYSDDKIHQLPLPSHQKSYKYSTIITKFAVSPQFTVTLRWRQGNSSEQPGNALNARLSHLFSEKADLSAFFKDWVLQKHRMHTSKDADPKLRCSLRLGLSTVMSGKSGMLWRHSRLKSWYQSFFFSLDMQNNFLGSLSNAWTLIDTNFQHFNGIKIVNSDFKFVHGVSFFFTQLQYTPCMHKHACVCV